MSTQFQFRRDTAAVTNNWTGAEGEVTVNTTNQSLVVHDGQTPGGFEAARADLVNVDDIAFKAKADAAGIGAGNVATATITAVSQASIGVVTTTANHLFGTGQKVTFTDVNGMIELNSNSYYCKVLTGTTFELYADPALTIPVNTTSFTTYTTGGTVVATNPAAAPLSSPYLVVTADPALSNERVLTAGQGLVLTDSGAGGSATVSANLSNVAPNALGIANAGSSTAVSRSDHTHALPTSADIGAVPTSRKITAGTGITGGGTLTADINISLNAELTDINDVSVTSLTDGDVLVYNSLAGQWENSKDLPTITTQINNITVGTEGTIKTVNFDGPAVTLGQISLAADSDPSKVTLSIPEIFTEQKVNDLVGNMVVGSQQSGVLATFDSINKKIDFAVNEFDINLTGDVTGTATVTALGDVVINTSLATNSVQLGTDTEGDYVRSVTVLGNGLSVTPATPGEGSNLIVSIASSSLNTPNQLVVRDANGSFSANVITATLNGSATQNILKTGDTMTGPLVLSGPPTTPLQATTKAYVDSAVQTTAFTFNTSADSGAGSVQSGTALRVTGGTGILTTADANVITVTNTGVTSITAGTGITLNATTGAITISASGVVAGVSAINSQSGAVTIQGVSGKIEVDSPSAGIVRINIPSNVNLNDVTATTLSADTITSTGNITAGNIITPSNVTGANLIALTTVSSSSITKIGTNGVGNIGQSTNAFNTVFAKAASAQYADLAESYLADAEYAPGTVVCFGGIQEVTVTEVDADSAVAGIVSTNPAYEMNAALTGEFVCKVGLTGRLPCLVKGPVYKGSLLVSAGNGYARAESNPRPGTIIGKSLENFEGETGVIEVVVGRF